jgi:hypothetical protein
MMNPGRRLDRIPLSLYSLLQPWKILRRGMARYKHSKLLRAGGSRDEGSLIFRRFQNHPRVPSWAYLSQDVLPYLTDRSCVASSPSLGEAEMKSSRSWGCCGGVGAVTTRGAGLCDHGNSWLLRLTYRRSCLRLLQR